jgi:hypothetical protein
MTAEALKSILDVLRAANVMQAHVKSGHEEIAVTFGPEPMPADLGVEPAPGGWKTQPSDPHDPDPLGLGSLDAPIAYDEVIE